MNQRISSIDFFPLSVASGQAFCNREEESKRLKACIQHLRPVLLVSPRRYGKTSLALHVIEQMKQPFALIDLFSSVDEQDIEKNILKGVGKLISRMERMPKRALDLAKSIFEGTNIRVVLSEVELSLEVNRRKEKPAYLVLDILERLERLAEKADKKIILFFDEFQCIGEITPDHAMEGVLRQVAQLTKSISFIFSGSNRHLLNQLFEDRKRPFYKLCERVTLDRISADAYIKHIQKVWNTTISERIFECLFNYSERHPYYINLLCSRILVANKQLTAESIEQTWHQYVMEERSSVATEMELLSKNQKKLLTILARVGGTGLPLGRVFIQQANMSKATIDQALTFLERRDYVFKNEHGHFGVLDPLIKAVLSGEANE